MTLAPIRPDVAAPKFIPCPPFCDGLCDEWYDAVDGSRYHGSDFHKVSAAETDRGAENLVVTVTRLDVDTQPGDPEIHLLMGDRHGGDDWQLTVQNARRLAAVLLNLTDAADPLPLGETPIQAQHLRVGDEILTDDGWQHIYQTLIDENNDYAAAFTPERHGEDTDGWVFKLADPVRVRRTMLPGMIEAPTAVRTIGAEGIRYGDYLLTGDGWQKVVGLLIFEDSDQVSVYTPEQDDEHTDGWRFSFGEPVQVRRTMPEMFEVPGRCSHCHADRTITGRRSVSSTGIVRIRGGHCRTCGKGGLNVLLERNGTMVPGARRLPEVTA